MKYRTVPFTASTAVLILCLLGYLKPPCTSWQPLLSALFNGLRLLGIGLSVAYGILSRVRLSKFTWILGGYQLLLVLVTLFRGGNVVQAAVGGATILGQLVLFETAIKGQLLPFLKITCGILTAYVIINFFTVLLIPQGLYRTENNSPVFFLGMHNRFVFWMLPLLCLSCIYAYFTRGRLTWFQYGLHLLCLTTLLIQWAVGATIGLLILAVYFWVLDRLEIGVADYRVYLAVYGILWAALTFTDFLQVFSWITEGLLGKGGNLAARLRLWDKGKELLSRDWGHLLFGYGLESDETIRQTFWYVHLHNNLLNVMYQTGLVGTAVYAGAFLSLVGPLVRWKHHPVGKLLAFVLFAFFIMLLMDTYDLYGHFYVLAALGAHAGELCRQQTQFPKPRLWLRM